MPTTAAKPFTLDGARVLLSGGLSRKAVSVAKGLIVGAPCGRRVDVSGFLILPGIVDLHGDAFERHLAPRRGALRNLGDGLRALETELGGCGITTAWLAQFWSWQGGMRGPDFARRLCVALADFDAALDMRVQLRLEAACHADFDEVAALVAGCGIDMLVLADHLPHDALATGKRPPRLDGQALRAGCSPADHLALMKALHEGMPEARARLPGFMAALVGAGVTIGTHDDDVSVDNTLSGVGIAEFPISRAAAEAARATGRGIVLGAPNVVRGGSHGSGVSARELIADGLCDALASDYHYPSLAQAALMLEDDGMALGEAWALVSSGPARLLGLADRGVIEQGKRADLVIIEEDTRRIVCTIAAGRFAWMAAPMAARLL